MSDRPIFRRIIDAIHALQQKTATIEERSSAWEPQWPESVSMTPRFGTLIDRFRCVYASHYALAPGSVVKFGTEQRTVTSVMDIGNDIGIAAFSEAVSVQPMRVLPWDWTRFLSVERDGSALKRPLPVWRCNQRGQVVPMRIVRLDGKFYFDSSVNNGIENGDSGSPVFIGLEQPVLIGVTKTRAGGGSLAGNWKAVQTWATEVKEAVW